MPGLVQVTSQTISTSTASISLIDSSPTDTVYVLTILNLQVVTDNVSVRLRYTKASDDSVDTTSNYDFARRDLKSYADAGNGYSQNVDYHFLGQEGTPAQESVNGIYQIYNLNNSSEFTFINDVSSNWNSISKLSGSAGGGVHTVNQANNGVNISTTSGNIDTGIFTLYKLG